MQQLATMIQQHKKVSSHFLKREVSIDLYLPANLEDPSQLSLLLINDGQDLRQMHFTAMLDQLLFSHQIQPLLCVGIDAGDRKQEYGTAKVLDYEGRGSKASTYQQFIIEELLLYLHTLFCVESFQSIGVAGFSIGGLSAMDMLWNHPDLFSIVGVFSGSFWWRTKSLDDHYNEETDRIMHQQIRYGKYRPGLRFYFTTGSLDETSDRNHNGIIDSIDDTLALIEELVKKGYNTDYDIRYLNYEEGRHDIAAWGKAMPQFLLWGWGRRG